MSQTGEGTTLYTTGEVAKLCSVSVRTVQYYDDRGILIPSQLSEGGRRLYTEEDVKRILTGICCSAFVWKDRFHSFSLAPELARGCRSKDKRGRACKSRYLCNGTAYLQESRQAAVRQLRYSQLAKEQGGASRGGRYRRYRATRRAERKTPGPEKGAPPWCVNIP